MSTLLRLGEMRIEVVRKPIRNLHLSVYPPDGRVRIAAPERATTESLRLFAVTKLGWIRRQQRKFREQARESAREYLERESHYVWGRRYLLRVVERDAPPTVELMHRVLRLQVRPDTTLERRSDVLESWYRSVLKSAVPDLIARWEPRLGVRVNRIYIQRMKTRWGGCNSELGNIRINTELAKKPPECLEYIIVHELAHLREHAHGAGFIALMDRALPNWRDCRAKLNNLPVRNETWPRLRT